MMTRTTLVVLLASLIYYSEGQSLLRTISPQLLECYENPDLRDANLKFPMTINYLIELIRETENLDSLKSIQKLAPSILHTFRQDGIKKASNVKSAKVIPYGASGHEIDLLAITLHKFIPGNNVQYPNNTLLPDHKCALHQMISESMETVERGDESLICDQKDKYRLRIARDIEGIEDVELLPGVKNVHNKRGNINQSTSNPNSDFDILPRINVPNGPISRCPLERGVIYTKWGAISAGNVIAGIAAGSEPQDVPIDDNKYVVENVFGATLAGGVAEAAYLSAANGENIDIGAEGNFLPYQVPQGYYVTKQKNFYLTDAEIRGNLDGLILGTQMKGYRNLNVRMSQLLDMYYSQRGLFSENIKACKRQELYAKYAPSDKLKENAVGAAISLSKISTVSLTINDDAIRNYVGVAVDELDKYIPSNFGDPNCIDRETYQTVDADLVILLDFSWAYEIIYPTLWFLLDNIDFNRFNTRVTIVNANSGEIILNNTGSFLDYALYFNKSRYDLQTPGFNLNTAVKTIEELTREKIENERTNQTLNGRSLIGLFVSKTVSVENTNREFVINRINEVIRPQLPDLRLLALTGGPTEDYFNIVKDSSKDIYQLDESNGAQTIQSLNKLASRFKEVPNRLSSFKCTVNWTETGNERELIQYVELNGINYYRLHPNYFFASGTRNVKVKGSGSGPLNVCHSREIELPIGDGSNNQNATKENTDAKIICKIINGEEFNIELQDPCTGKSMISECQPLFVSVQSKGKGGGSTPCTDTAYCRFPDNVKYTISLDNMGCYSAAGIAIINFYTLVSMLCIIFIRNIQN